MQWSERLATGIPELDKHHKMLFTMAADYRETLNEERGERMYALWLDTLDEYAKAHFGAEEGCMHRYHCPVAATNSKAHRYFTDVLDTFRKLHAERGYDVTDAWRLVEFIEDWLSNHIGQIDVQLRPCVEEHKP